MDNNRILITGSNGLIGSQVVSHFDALGWEVHGIDNNMRADFFGPGGDTRGIQHRLEATCRSFHHHELDIRDREGMLAIVEQLRPGVMVNSAAQPSHDLAARRTFDDFEVNAVGTLNLLQAARQYAPETVLVHISTNKVYGDTPNELPLKELPTRWEYARPEDYDGIREDFPIDHSKHSLYGVSKLAADIMVQEYGRYFGMKTCCLRGGCLTGPNHAGVELHGFLSYLVKCNLAGNTYRIFGYKGKQVRDNIHSYDVARFIEEFVKAPRIAGVYNLGGGRENSCSILEAIELVESITGKPMKYEYVEENRIGDHICYISNLSKMKEHYPSWDITKDLPQIVTEIAEALRNEFSGSLPIATE